MSKGQHRAPVRKASDSATRAKYPRHSVERALRIPKAILEQNAGKPSTPEQAAVMLGGSSAKGPFAVEIASAMKYGFLDREEGKIHPTELEGATENAAVVQSLIDNLLVFRR
jgi:hypothetical protein